MADTKADAPSFLERWTKVITDTQLLRESTALSPRETDKTPAERWDEAARISEECGGPPPRMPRPAETTNRPEDKAVAVTLPLHRWAKVVAYLDWHGKDHESELIVDAIREQTAMESADV